MRFWCAAAASPRKAVHGAFPVWWCVSVSGTPGVNRNSCGLVKECFCDFSIAQRQKEAQYELFLPQRFTSVLLTLASLQFARRRRLAQLTAATAATTRGFSHKCYENKWKKCHRFSSDEA